MIAGRVFCVTLLGVGLIGPLQAQEMAPNPAQEYSDAPVPQLLPGAARPTDVPAGRPASVPDAGVPQKVALTVPKGTSLQVALEGEVRIQRVGQSVHAQVIEPVYAFDRLVVPVGSTVRGEVSRIEPVSRGKRTLAGLDGDFTPARKIEVRFTDLVLADGKDIPLHTSVMPGSGQVLKFVSAPDK